MIEKYRVPLPALFTLGLISLLLMAGISRGRTGADWMDMQIGDTKFVVLPAHAPLMMIPILALFAILYFGIPKLWGRPLNETLGTLHFWLTLLSFYYFIPRIHNLISDGLGRDFQRVNFCNALVTTAMGIGQAVFLFNLLWSLVRK